MRAAMAMARLDATPPATPHAPSRWARSESLALAAREGLACDEARLLAHRAGGGVDVVSRVERTTDDLLRAVEAVREPGWIGDAADLASAWRLSDASNARSPTSAAAYEHGLERDAARLARVLDGIGGSVDPRDGAEAVALVCRERLFPRPDRMACLVADLALSRSVGIRHGLLPLARHLPDATVLAGDATAAVRAVLDAVRVAGERAAERRRGDVELRQDLLRKVSGERADARTGRAVDAFIDVPIQSVTGLASRLGMTFRGANVVVGRLVEAGILRPHRGNKLKGRLFVCDRALDRQG